MNYVARIHLNIKGSPREKLIDYCLKSQKQCIAIGWTEMYKENKISTYADYRNKWKSAYKNQKLPSVCNVFQDTKQDDLFWTRDLDGMYWICKVTGTAEAKHVEELGIGALVPVKAYRYGLEVPGRIKASFNRPRGGTSERMYEKEIMEFSKYAYNQCSGEDCYCVEKLSGSLLDNLPDFDLEELVISYIQLKHNYYVLSNSIAKKSTTIKIECEFISRDKSCIKKAVVQVKAKQGKVKASDYKKFSESGYTVFLYCGNKEPDEGYENFVYITEEELNNFYYEYKNILPESITKWEELIR